MTKKYNKLQRTRINGRLEMLEADKRKNKVDTGVIKAKQEIEMLEKVCIIIVLYCWAAFILKLFRIFF